MIINNAVQKLIDITRENIERHRECIALAEKRIEDERTRLTQAETELNHLLEAAVKGADLWQVQELVDKTAAMIAVLPTDKWLQWIGYLLEELQQDAPSADAYTAFLEDLKRHIEQQLEHGQWL